MVDLRREWFEHGADFQAAFSRVVQRGLFILGPEVEAFEHEYASYCGVSHAIAVASGTDAITLALVAAGINPGDEVITSTLTSAATVTAILRAGCLPVLTDVDPESLNIDVNDAERCVSERTRAIVPVHLYGRLADVSGVQRLARKTGLKIIDDACQAHGAAWNGHRAGSLGDASCFSFYPTKNLGAYGDGGMVTTSSPEIASRLRLVRQYGWRERDRSEVLGFNSRLDEMQAALLRTKLPHLDRWNRKRRSIAELYKQGLAKTHNVRLPVGVDGHVFHLFVIRVPERDRIKDGLTRRGVRSGIHFPVPIHRQPAFAGFVRGNHHFPVAEAAVKEILSLPMFPFLSPEEIARVIDSLIEELLVVSL